MLAIRTQFGRLSSRGACPRRATADDMLRHLLGVHACPISQDYIFLTAGSRVFAHAHHADGGVRPIVRRQCQMLMDPVHAVKA